MSEREFPKVPDHLEIKRVTHNPESFAAAPKTLKPVVEEFLKVVDQLRDHINNIAYKTPIIEIALDAETYDRVVPALQVHVEHDLIWKMGLPWAFKDGEFNFQNVKFKRGKRYYEDRPPSGWVNDPADDPVSKRG